MKSLILICLLATGCAQRVNEPAVTNWCAELKARTLVLDWCLKGGCRHKARVIEMHEEWQYAAGMCEMQARATQKLDRVE